MIWLPVFVAVGAATFWLRGSALWHQLTKTGKTTGDFAWAAALAALAFAAGYPLLAVPGLIVALWLGGRLGWWGSLDMGHAHHTVGRDLVFHSARGLLWTLPAAAYCVGVTLWLGAGSLSGAAVLAAVGLTAGPAWWLGFKLRPPVYQAIHQPDGSIHMHYDAADQKRPWATEIGELIYGALIGAGLWAAVCL